MKVKITTHFDYLTPFSEAKDDEQLAHIMRLKYPKACSGLETEAEFFADMVEQVGKYDAWRVIGFDSFEAFCRDKLGKTLDEVNGIVAGVNKLRGEGYKGPITEKQAIKASEEQRRLKRENPDMTYAEIGEVTGTTRQAAHKACQPKACNREKVDNPRITIRLTLDPARTAANIRAKMGDEYAARLKEAL